ncbi:collagen alpha-3(IV) chain-like [Branchiostoma lanceolatum]|uniref:collagen alpha-3(IV) chain-like n=1 Tax=Branchiostoma lanceolatum TaxID=7740 RepID=UPI003456881A
MNVRVVFCCLVLVALLVHVDCFWRRRRRRSSGHPGTPGSPGSRGPPGPRGPPGYRGSPGPKGSQGSRGFPGSPGRQGPPGHKGMQGAKGVKGYRGPVGPIGPTGQMGSNGDKGEQGIQGPPGERGIQGPQGNMGLKGGMGYRGVKGETGPIGPKGDDGIMGAKGDMGERGPQGVVGPISPPGSKGDTGPIGIQGPVGPPGAKGDVGPEGLKGVKGDTGAGPVIIFYPISLIGGPGSTDGNTKGQLPPPSLTVVLITIHSQTHDYPQCLHGLTPLFQGFSLVQLGGHGITGGQDLGSLGSCLTRFSVHPFMQCQDGNLCNDDSAQETTLWLASETGLPPVVAGQPPPDEEAVLPALSRCVVCSTHVPVQQHAIHSQTSAIPDCNLGWTSLWTGYSFIPHTSHAGAGGTFMSSPGSCLQSHRDHPLVGCNSSTGTCEEPQDQSSFWLQATGPGGSTITTPAPAAVSRCRVCQYNGN